MIKVVQFRIPNLKQDQTIFYTKTKKKMSKRSLGSRIDKDECGRESPGQKKPWGEKVVVTGYASWFTNEKGTQ